MYYNMQHNICQAFIAHITRLLYELLNYEQSNDDLEKCVDLGKTLAEKYIFLIYSYPLLTQ